MIPNYYIKFLCCRSSKSVKRLSKPDFYLNQGIEKLSKDMDVVNWIRMVHNVDIMHSLLFTEIQQFLLKFQRRLVIDSNSSESEIDRIYAR